MLLKKSWTNQQISKGLPLDLARISRAAKASDHKVFHSKCIKISTPKQMLQRFPIVLAQIKSK